MKRLLSFLMTFVTVFMLVSAFAFNASAATAYDINGNPQNSADFILDPGHGGSDPGAVGPYGRHEANEVLDMAKRVGSYLIASGATVSFTRLSNTDTSLANRVSMEKSGNYRYYLSIHRNAGGGTGVETFYYEGSSSGYNLANAVNSRVAAVTGWRNRGLKTNSLYVVRNTRCPAALIELGFVDTEADNAVYDANADAIARAIAEGLLSLIGKTLVVPNQPSTPQPPATDTTQPPAADTTQAPAPTLLRATDSVVALQKIDGYEYRMNNGAWQTSSVFTGLSPMKKYVFFQRVAQTGTSSTGLVVTTDKSTPSTPLAPTVSSKTDTTVTLVKKDGYEYSKDGNTWRASNVFSGLKSETEYSFYQRVAKTDTSYASKSSKALTVKTNSPVPTSTTSSTYMVSGSTISKITDGTTVSSLLSELSAGKYCKVYKDSTVISNADKIGTGMTVKIMDGNTAKASYTVVVTGDTNGDGDITITDMLAVKSHVLNKTLLTEASLTAADTSGDSAVTITDFIQIKAKILDKGNIVAR